MAHDAVTAAVPSIVRAVARGWSDTSTGDAGAVPMPRGSGRQLPPGVRAGMNAAVRAELARRMPVLNAGMIALCQGRNVDLAAAIRDAHTLASGSEMLGETSAAMALRRVESELASPQAKRDVHVIAEQLTVASVALSAWLPGQIGPCES